MGLDRLANQQQQQNKFLCANKESVYSHPNWQVLPNSKWLGQCNQRLINWRKRRFRQQQKPSRTRTPRCFKRRDSNKTTSKIASNLSKSKWNCRPPFQPMVASRRPIIYWISLAVNVVRTWCRCCNIDVCRRLIVRLQDMGRTQLISGPREVAQAIFRPGNSLILFATTAIALAYQRL